MNSLVQSHFLLILVPLALLTIHLLLGERVLHSLTPVLDVRLDAATTLPEQGSRVRFDARLAFGSRERADITEVRLKVRGPQSFEVNLPLDRGEFDVSGMPGVVGTVTGWVRYADVSAPFPSVYKGASTGGAIIFDALWIPDGDMASDGDYTASLLVRFKDASSPLSSQDARFSIERPTPTPTFTATVTLTPSPTATATLTSTPTPTKTPTLTATPTRTRTPTPSRTATPFPTATLTKTATPTGTVTPTPSATLIPTPTQPPTTTAMPTLTPTATFVPTLTVTETTVTYMPTVEPTPSHTPTAPQPPTPMPSPSPTDTAVPVSPPAPAFPQAAAPITAQARVSGSPGAPVVVRISPSDPSKPLVLVVDGYASATASATPMPQGNTETAASPNDRLARYSAPDFLGFSAGLMLVALTALALLRSRQGMG